MSTPKVESIMVAPPVTVPATATMGWVEAQLRLADVHQLPVVDVDGKLIAMVCAHDVARARRDGGDHPVTEYMTRRLKTVHPGVTLRQAIAAMLDAKVSSLPVVDSRHRPVGIVTAADLLRLADRLLAEHHAS